MAFQSRLTAVHSWGISGPEGKGGSVGAGAGGRDAPDTPDTPSPVSVQGRRGPARGARGGTGGGTQRGGTRGAMEMDPTAGMTVGQSRRMAAVAAQTRERQRQADMRQKAELAYDRMVQSRISKMDTAATALSASAPFTGLLGVLGGALAGGMTSLAEREAAGEFTFGLGGMAQGMMGGGSKAEFIDDFMAGNVTVDAKGNVSRTDKGRAEQPEAVREGRPGRSPMGRDTPDAPSPMRAQAQRERPLAETPETEKITPEQVLNPPLFEEPQEQVPGVGAMAMPSWLRRVRADVERARRAGERGAFL